jgi:SAM-dependent MidA family methyltransferase
MNEVAQRIREAIANQGAIPFEQFMRLALYSPVYGYYERQKENIGKRGDYYTSVSVGSLFGELLGFQFAAWLEGMPQNPIGSGPAQIIEAGAHRGDLAKDILGSIREYRPQLFKRLEYGIIEPSGRRQEWQRETLKAFAPKVNWFHDFNALQNGSLPLDTPHPSHSPSRIIFSNELLDSMPVQRLGWDAKARAWFEWGVTMKGEGFDWLPMEPSKPLDLDSQIPAALLAVLPNGFTIERGLEAEQWLRDAAQAVGVGKLVTIDYGLEQEQLFAPERTGGTLRAFTGHLVSDDVLANPGEQDLTAHVNFTGLRETAERLGLRTEAFVTQEHFLTQIAARAWQAGPLFPPWTDSRKRQFQTLTHPEHLGRAFRVLVQSREARCVMRDA